MVLESTSLFLRVASIASKLGVLFYLIKILTPSDFILYGVIVVSVVYLQYIIGLDLYTYANRQIALNNSRIVLIRTITKQYSFYFCFYLLILSFATIAYFYYSAGYYEVPLWGLIFCLVLITEHYYIESYRLWVFIAKPIFAAFLYFVKSTLFFLIIAICSSNYSSITLEIVLVVWLFVNCISILISTCRINVFMIVIRLWSFDVQWLKKAVTFSFPLVLSALCSKAVFTFDRSLADWLLDTESAATYIVLMSIFFALNSVLDSVFFVFKLPVLVNSTKGDFNREFKIFFKTALILILLGAFSFLPGFYLSIIVFSDKVNDSSQVAFYLMAVLFLLFNLSQVYHYALYANGLSKKILRTQFWALILCVVIFMLGVIFKLTIYIEFFIFCVGIYSFCVAYLKRRVFVKLLQENSSI